jgi:hypothetical protein
MGNDATMTKDGQLVSPRPNWAQVPQNDRKLISAFNSQIMDSLAILALPLPNKKVEPGDVWPIEKKLTIPLDSSAQTSETVLFQAHCEYIGMRWRSGRAEAVITFLGAPPQLPGKKGWLNGTLRGEAIVDLETGQIILATLRTNLSGDFEAGRLNKDAAHAGIFLKTTLRRTNDEPPATLDPRTMLPHQTIVLSPLVGVGVP